MYWWTYFAKFLALQGSCEACKLKLLFVAGTSCQLLITKMVLTMWGNLLLKLWDIILGKLRDKVSFNSFMELRNASLSGSLDFFPRNSSDKAVEKSSLVLHDEAVRKAVTLEKPPKKLVKKIQFSQESWQSQSAKCSGPQSWAPSVRGASATPSSSSSKGSSSSGKCGRRNRF